MRKNEIITGVNPMMMMTTEPREGNRDIEENSRRFSLVQSLEWLYFNSYYTNVFPKCIADSSLGWHG